MLKINQFDSLMSTEEYISFLASFKKENSVDITTDYGLNRHVYRNKNQFHKAPKDLKNMLIFVENGWYIKEGYSPCHNIPFTNDTAEMRKEATKATARLYMHDMLQSMNPFSLLGNISFRGVSGTPFEGCQFVYNSKTGKLVTDNTNKGTFDYGKYGTPAHYVLDVQPWLLMGNGEATETEKDFILPAQEEQKYLKKKFSLMSTPNTTRQIILEDGTKYNI